MLHSVWRCIVLQQGDVIAGAGLLVLLELCSSTLTLGVQWSCIAVGFLIALLMRGVSTPLFRGACLVYNLLVSLSVCLNLFARLCPIEGKELALIPVYVLLCMSRPALKPLAGVVLSAISLAFVIVFVVALWVNPGARDVKLEPFSEWPIDAPDSALWQGFSLVILVIYGSISPMFLVYTANEVPPPWEYFLIGGICRLVVLAIVGSGKSALLSYFMSQIRFSLHPLPPNYLSAVFGICQLIACMHLASEWFRQLKSLTALVSGRAYAAQRLVRLQHIVNAGVVGLAWAFPLDYRAMRILVVVGLQLLRLV